MIANDRPRTEKRDNRRGSSEVYPSAASRASTSVTLGDVVFSTSERVMLVDACVLSCNLGMGWDSMGMAPHSHVKIS